MKRRWYLSAVMGVALLLTAAPTAAQDYATREVENTWDGGTMELLLTDREDLVGLRDEDFCRFMASITTDAGTTPRSEEAIATCVERLSEFETEVWLPESMLRVIAPPTVSATDEGLHTIQGRFVLRDKNADWMKGEPCRGRLGYSDIDPRTQVIVRDSDAKILGAAQLGKGKLTKPTRCLFTYTIRDVPDSPFYEIGSERRGFVTYSYEDLASRGWRVTLSLG